MIHTAKVLASYPGTLWAQKKQTLRDRTVYEPENQKLIRFEGRLVKPGIVFCEKNSVKVWTSSGDKIDTNSELEYEFVQYDERRRLMILAVMTGDGPAGGRFDAIFTKLKPSDVYLENRAFLIIPTKPAGEQITSMALMPTGEDTHDNYGVCASPEYLARLLRASGR